MHTSPSLLAHVHETHEGLSTIELTPPHLPREDTPEYRARITASSSSRIVPASSVACAIATCKTQSPQSDPTRITSLAD